EIEVHVVPRQAELLEVAAHRLRRDAGLAKVGDRREANDARDPEIDVVDDRRQVVWSKPVGLGAKRTRIIRLSIAETSAQPGRSSSRPSACRPRSRSSPASADTSLSFSACAVSVSQAVASVSSL